MNPKGHHTDRLLTAQVNSVEGRSKQGQCCGTCASWATTHS